MSRAQLQRRVKALDALIRPAKGLAGRVAKLGNQHRFLYQQWQEELRNWHGHHRGDEAYRLLLTGEEGPKLHQSVAKALGVDPPKVLEHATIAEAAEIYRRCLEQE